MGTSNHAMRQTEVRSVRRQLRRCAVQAISLKFTAYLTGMAVAPP